MKTLFISLFLSFFLISSCTNSADLIAEIEEINTKISKKYAPDKRVAIYKIDVAYKNESIYLSGETNKENALKKLVDNLQNRQISIVNKVRILPDSAVGKKIYAVAKNSVINIRSKPKHSAELGTQGLLGMSLKVFDKKGDFYRVQTPDNYISWVDKGGITLMTKEEFANWNQQQKIIYTQNTGSVYRDAKTTSSAISDIVFGGLLILEEESKNFYKVTFPDKRIGFVKKSEAVLYNYWLINNPETPENIENYAKRFLGFPYLWGGTSTKGVDCSGFTKTVYLMNGFVIPRDASQQILAGKTVDANLEFTGLQKGDLMFFGKKATEKTRQRVTHVGIWLGNGKGEFIHSSGRVHLSSINKEEKNYDAYNTNRYLGSKRYLGVTDDKIINLKATKTIKN